MGVVLCFLQTGCGNKVPLRGKVVFSDDASPVTCGTVYFTSASYLARGDIRSDGTFVVESEKVRDGLLPGTYTVSLSGVEKPSGKTIHGVETRVSMIDKKYASSKTSGLTVTVNAKTKTYDIQVDRGSH